MANIVRFDPNDSIVPNKVIEYLISVNTPDYSGNILINPSIGNLIDIPIKYWKYYNGLIIEMEQVEKSLIDNASKAIEIPSKNYLVKEYNTNKNLVKEIWYEIDNGNGLYSLKSEEIEYVYSNKTLNSRILRKYNYGGEIIDTEQWNYYTNSSNKTIEKRVK